MVFLGLLLATVGTDLETGQERVTLGIQQLSDGIDFAPLAMGIFGFAEIIRNLEEPEARDVVRGKIGKLMPSWAEIKQSIPPVLRGTGIGAILGILPGNGAVLGPSHPTRWRRSSRKTRAASARARSRGGRS